MEHRVGSFLAEHSGSHRAQSTQNARRKALLACQHKAREAAAQKFRGIAAAVAAVESSTDASAADEIASIVDHESESAVAVDVGESGTAAAEAGDIDTGSDATAGRPDAATTKRLRQQFLAEFTSPEVW